MNRRKEGSGGIRLSRSLASYAALTTSRSNAIRRCGRTGNGHGNQDPGRIRLRGPGSPRAVLGGGAPLQAAGPARGIRFLGGGPPRVEGARGGVELRERDRRPGGTGTADLLPTDGHPEAGEEPPPPGPQCEQRDDRPFRDSEGPGRLGGRAAPQNRRDEATSMGRAAALQSGTGGVLGRPAGPRGQRILRPVTSFPATQYRSRSIRQWAQRNPEMLTEPAPLATSSPPPMLRGRPTAAGEASGPNTSPSRTTGSGPHRESRDSSGPWQYGQE